MSDMDKIVAQAVEIDELHDRIAELETRVEELLMLGQEQAGRIERYEKLQQAQGGAAVNPSKRPLQGSEWVAKKVYEYNQHPGTKAKKAKQDKFDKLRKVMEAESGHVWYGNKPIKHVGVIR